MQFKQAGVALALVWGLSAAQAATVDFEAFTLEYDDQSALGSLSGSFSSSDNLVGFNWNLPSSLKVVSVDGPAKSVNFSLPSFTITAKPGWTLSGPLSSFFGNLSFVEVGIDAQTSASVVAGLTIDGISGPVTGNINRVVTDSSFGNYIGYYGETATQAYGSFQTLSVTNPTLTLTAGGGIYAAVFANEQNQFRVAITAAPVPEPESWAMMLAGVGLLAGLARRRLRHQG